MDHSSNRLSSTRRPPQRTTSLQDLLAAFGSRKAPTSVSRAKKNAMPSDPPMADTSPNASQSDADMNVSGDDIQVAVPEEPPRRTLRPRPSRFTSTTVVTSPPSLRSGLRQKRDKKKILTSDTIGENSASSSSQKDAPVLKKATARMQIREDIAQNTKAKQDRFLKKHGDFFLPLLPENNYITKMKWDDERFVPYTLLEEQPEGVTATLKPYQLAGLSFLVHMYKNGMPCMLGDEMGLGKTLQTLSLFQFLEEHQGGNACFAESRPYLVVCPMSVLDAWVTEARRWTPGLKVLRFHGPPTEREHLKKVATGRQDTYGNETSKSRRRKGDRRRGRAPVPLGSDEEGESDYKLVITTYDTFVAEQKWFKAAFVWRYAVLDEGHRIKNSSTNASHALQSLRAEYRLILTGTPLQNDLMEMWSLLHWLLPTVFTAQTSGLFKESFDLTNGKVSTVVMDHARHLLELLMLRRMKNSPEVDLNLPPKEEILLFVPLAPMQRFWYTRLLTGAGDNLLIDLFKDVKIKEKTDMVRDLKEAQDIKRLEEIGDQMSKQSDLSKDAWKESREIMRQGYAQEQSSATQGAWKRLMNLVMQLRKCCNHPYTLPHAAPEPYLLGDHVIQASGKFIVLEKLLRELVMARGKKVIVFSSFTQVLNCCEDLLAVIGGDGELFRYLRFDGGTGRARRNLDIRLFNDRSSEYKVMLISTRAGGLGINLTAATEVIFLDEDWNPQITLQAEARAHRIGQTQPVTVYKLCTQGTVEEQMMGRIRKKLYLSTKITETMKSIHSTTAKNSKDRTSTKDQDVPQLDVSHLQSLVRRGAQTLTHPEIDVTDMLSWDFNTILEKCKDKPSDPHVGDDDRHLDEQQWLSTMERVECAVFDGKRYQRQLDDDPAAVPDLTARDRRKGKNTTVMVDGYAISKESMNCGDWEAVPTMAGKDPRLADPKRAKKAAIVNQDHCQICWDGGKLLICSGCPRSYHVDCMNDHDRANATKSTNFSGFYCSQHECADCYKKTTDAGGLIFRCRWCERGYCEDCLEWNKTKLFGNTLPEFEILGFPAVDQAFFIECLECCELRYGGPEPHEFYEEREEEIKQQYARMLEMRDATPVAVEVKKEKKPKLEVTSSFTNNVGSLDLSDNASSNFDMTDATTLDTSGVSTPKEAQPVLKKRKAQEQMFDLTGLDDKSLGSFKKARKVKVEDACE